ncbi:CaiB/BaiF CoA transferase family protein, partial [Streptomyces roseolus]
LDATALNRRHPSLIPCAVTGYGSTGPWADRKAYDLLVQSQTGLVSLTGTPEETARTGVSIADIAAGMYAYSGILTALFTRATTGVARAVEVSLFEALAEWMSQPAHYTRHGGTQPPRMGTRHATIAPYGAFTTADGRQILLSVQNGREWAAFCTRLLDRPELAGDPRFATGSGRVAHREAVDTLVAERFLRSTADELADLLDEAGIAWAGVNDVHAFLGHPVLAARGRWQDVAVPGSVVPALRPPVDLAGTDPRMDPVPALGEHTEPILTELGHTRHQIEELRAEGAI